MLNLIEKWEKANSNLKEAKKLELDLRNEIIQTAFNENLNEEGTFNKKLNEALELKCHISFRRNIDLALLEQVKDELLKRGEFWQDYFTYDPKLNLKNYKTSNEKIRKLIDRALVIKPALPRISLHDVK